jgi:hypothetical protein
MGASEWGKTPPQRSKGKRGRERRRRRRRRRKYCGNYQPHFPLPHCIYIKSFNWFIQGPGRNNTRCLKFIFSKEKFQQHVVFLIIVIC